MNVHGSCVCGQKVGFLIQSRSIGMEHLHFWFSFAKRKKKKQKNKQNTCLWLLLPSSEQNFKELSGNRTWHYVSQVGTKILVLNVQGEHTHDLQENPSNVHSLVEESSVMPLLWISSTIPGPWEPAPCPGIDSDLVPYVYNQILKLMNTHSNSLWVFSLIRLGYLRLCWTITTWLRDTESVLFPKRAQQFT